MSRTPLACPECGAVLAHRRWHGNTSPLVKTEPGPEPDSVWLICDCGGRRLVEHVRPILLSRRKVA